MSDRTEERPTPTVEDYLGVIYTLARDGQPAIGRRLAEWMEVSPPTVTATVQRMVRDGWVIMAEDKSIHLTEAGRKAAASGVFAGSGRPAPGDVRCANVSLASGQRR